MEPSSEGGVGSLDESISSALIAGVPFIFFENFRGQMKSQLVETCLRGTGIAPARAPHKGKPQVPTDHINWQLASNGWKQPAILSIVASSPALPNATKATNSTSILKAISSPTSRPTTRSI
jgi:hypothetical protein